MGLPTMEQFLWAVLVLLLDMEPVLLSVDTELVLLLVGMELVHLVVLSLVVSLVVIPVVLSLLLSSQELLVLELLQFSQHKQPKFEHNLNFKIFIEWTI